VRSAAHELTLQASQSFLAEKIMRKCSEVVTFAYKNSMQQKCKRMSNLLTIIQAKEILVSSRRKF
jgi:hypothetical protein